MKRKRMQSYVVVGDTDSPISKGRTARREGHNVIRHRRYSCQRRSHVMDGALDTESLHEPTTLQILPSTDGCYPFLYCRCHVPKKSAHVMPRAGN